MERRLAAIMLTDIVAYSRLMGLDEEGTIARQREHRKSVFEPAIGQHGGRVVKSTGDGLLVEFPSVVDAARCAIAVQNILADSDTDVPDAQRIQYRIGINLGDIVIDGDDILGDGVNVAARLEGLAKPGGLCVSGSVHDQLVGKLNAVFEDAGEQPVKNVPRPVRVWQWQPDQTVQSSPLIDEPPLPDKPSIAVLPFENMSTDPEQEFFADGMTEDIITELSRFEDLFVIASNTSFTYKTLRQDVKEIASALGVRFLLEGSVRKAGQRVRITAQLINGHDGRHVWAERYDGALEEVFDLQEAITSQVVGSILPQIARAELERVARGENAFSPAHELAWQAQDVWRTSMRQRDPVMLDRAIQMAIDAVDMNDKCGIAYQTICDGYFIKGLYRWGENPSAAEDLNEEWSKKFVSRLPNSYMAYRSLGVAQLRKRQFAEANQNFQHAHGLNPNDALVLRFWGLCEASSGDVENAKNHAQMAIRLSPKDPRLHEACLVLAMVAFIEKDNDEFERWAGKAIALQPAAPIRRAMMIAYAAETENEELLATHREAIMGSTPDFIPSLLRGENRLFEKAEHSEMLLAGLRKAGFSE